MVTDDDNGISKQPTPAASGTAGVKHVLDFNVPEISIQDVDEKQVPEMPNLESVWAKSFQSVRKKSFSSDISLCFCIYLNFSALIFLNGSNF